MNHTNQLVEDKAPPDPPTRFPGSLQDEYRRQWTRFGSWVGIGVFIGSGITLVTKWHASLGGTSSGMWGFFGILAWMFGGVAGALVAGYVEVRRSTQIRRNRQSGGCWNCGYLMTGNTSGTCPECNAIAEAHPTSASETRDN
ncbi:MAG: hypothetical protein AAGK09_11615 [Planctomycetota bacterium]